jgi:ribose transport system substrate-binding protein
MPRNRVVLAVAGLLVLGLAACSVPSDSGGAAAGGTSTSKLVGIVTISATDANNARVIAGVTDSAKAAGWTVEVVDAAGNADQANSAMRNFVSKGAGMIFDLVFPTSSLGAGLASAKQAGVPVATWGGGLGSGVVMTTGDGAPFAQPATQKMVDDLGASGSVLALTYRAGQVCRDREGVFDKIISADPGVQVSKEEVAIPGFLQDGSRYATAWLAGHPKGSGPLAIWGCWEDPTLGAISALKQQNRTDVKTYGINGSSTAIKAVQDGSLTATVYEDGAGEGKAMFDTTMQAIQAGAGWQPKTVNVPGILVTAETVGQFVQDHPEALK